MYKNQLQELAQRSCFNLPSYACTREGPDHAPRFKASVNFNGEIFESPSYCSTLRQAEHAAAELALNTLSTKGPSRSLTARVLDETGVYKNLLQETAHRAGLNLPVYTTVRSGPGHAPMFTSTVELAGMNFTGESAKTKKQAEKNAAIAAWSTLKNMPNLGSLGHTSTQKDNLGEQEQNIVSNVLSNFGPKDDTRTAKKKDQNHARRRMQRVYRDNNSPQYQQGRFWDLLRDSALNFSSTQKQESFVSLLPPPPPRTTSKILPLSSTGSPTRSKSTTFSNPVKVMGKSRVERFQEVVLGPLLDEHQKDEDEWLNGSSEFNNKHMEMGGPSCKSNSSSAYEANYIYRPFAMSNTSGKFNTSMLKNEETRIKPGFFAFPAATTQKALSHMKMTPKSSHMGPQGIAPAVQIRSVIPVCAAPPPPPPPMRSPTTIEASSTLTFSGAELLSASPTM